MLKPRSRQHSAAILSLGLVAALWGASFPFIKAYSLVAMEYGFSAWKMALVFTALRFGSSLVIWLLAIAHREVKAVAVRKGLAIGVVFGLGGMFQVAGLAYIDAARSGFLTGLAVVFTAVLDHVFRRRWPAPRYVVAVLMAFLGTAIVAGGSEFQIGISSASFGDLLTIVAAGLFSVVPILVERHSQTARSSDLTLGTLTGCLASTLACIVVVPGGGVPKAALLSVCDARLVGCIIFVAVASTVLPFYLVNATQRFVSATQAGLVYASEPLWAVAFAFMIPPYISAIFAIDYVSEVPSWTLVFGGFCIVGGAAITFVKAPSSN